jgi:hypothetical protein
MNRARLRRIRLSRDRDYFRRVKLSIKDMAVGPTRAASIPRHPAASVGSWPDDALHPLL